MTTNRGTNGVPEHPIPGVINTTVPEYLLDEIDSHGIDIGFEEHCKECTKQSHEGCYEAGAGTTYLLGYKKDLKGDYVPDPNAEFSAIVNVDEITTQITRSKWVSKTALCSPCYPGQGDLENSGENIAYTLPPSIWGNHDHLQINELSVALEAIREIYVALFDTDLDTVDFAEEFFYMVGNILSGKSLKDIYESSEMRPRGAAAGTLGMLLENKSGITKESKKGEGA